MDTIKDKDKIKEMYQGSDMILMMASDGKENYYAYVAPNKAGSAAWEWAKKKFPDLKGNDGKKRDPFMGTTSLHDNIKQVDIIK